MRPRYSRGHLVPVSDAEITTCKFCGWEPLAWVESKKGKRYLAEVYHDPQYGNYAAKLRWHVCPNRGKVPA